MAFVDRRSFMSYVLRISGGLLFVTLASFPWLYGQGTDTDDKRIFIHDRDVETGFMWEHFPRWNGRLLVGYENDHTNGPIFYTIDGDGRRDETLFTLPDGARINLYDIAVSAGGEIAIVGSALTDDKRSATFLAHITSNRQRQIVTRLWPYCAMVVTFAADGNIWTIGHLKDEENTHIVAAHVLRRFDSSGRMIGSRTIHRAGSDTQETSYLVSSRDRVGWFTREGEYIEFSLDGSEIARYEGPVEADQRDTSGVALSDDNDVVVGLSRNGKTELLTLDRGTRTWRLVALPKEHASTWTRVLGFDGITVVTTTASGRLTRFRTK